MDQPEGPVCYRFVCDRYPTCRRARGKGCCLDWADPEEETVLPGSCCEENGYPWYLPADPAWHRPDC